MREPVKERERFVSEALQPHFEKGCDEAPVAVGEPLLPCAFVWRGTSYPVLAVLSSGKGLGPCSHGSGERYVQKHWYRFETTDDLVMKVYMERRPRAGSKATKRWWLYSVTSGTLRSMKEHTR